MTFDPNGAPRAHKFDIRFCGHCPNAHLLFTDESGDFICQATMSLAQCRKIEEAIRANDPNFRK